MNTLAELIRTHGANQPEVTAFHFGDQAISYGELDARSNRVANALREAGVGAGDRVAILDKNGVEYFELLFATAKLGAVTVAINWRLAPREIAYIVDDSQARVMVFGAEYADTMTAISDSMSRVAKWVVIGDDDRFSDFGAWRDASSDSDPQVVTSGADIAFQVYSSGTTGMPKGVLLANENLFSLLPTSSQIWGIDASSINMVAMPLFHIGGCGWALVGLFHGCTSVLVREVDPAQLIELIGKYRVTHAFVVPALLQFMQRMPNAASGNYESLRLMIYGASPISEQVLAGAVRLMGCGFAQAYGLTETTGAIVTLPPEDHDLNGPNRHRLRAAGKPHDNVELRIVDPDTGEDLPLGTPGEIWTRSGQNLVGYWQEGRQEPPPVNEDGWLRTGDIGYFDADGYIYIHDRLKDMIITGGENVYPAEVENALMNHPAVADVAVIGIPSEKWGESPFAIVVPTSESAADEAEILGFARDNLAHFKVPVGIDFRAEIPRNASGKVLKKDLRAPYWAGQSRAVH
ncbi:long-chain-fatty-acid--CoA ligase [Haliangium ochraceum]|uniref:AMP-dependent synthetase and ligase n=1 Tax=Haliangium ochraceum (strain DSM 14365 / JCM 11303 / SMP-2) TaxID=502025 RepID=D0LWW9_HALO1|nr:long-chain-fatty-acid--CoA ligase [Haliangium ochraceum]ACY14216.1 AMP-dependent synthetase and ligase [Haliangium ochraceum DSM 14365]